jgi:hypothetical protein
MPPDTAVTTATKAVQTEVKMAHDEESHEHAEARHGGSVFVVDFHRDGNSAAYRTFGWSGQEESYVWSLRASSFLHLPGRIDNNLLTIELEFDIPTGRNGAGVSVIRVFANGHAIGSASVTGWTRLRCDVPEGIIVPGEPIDLCFEHPCFARMDVLDLGHDDRPLGICFYAVRLYPPWMKRAMDRFAPWPPEGRLIQAVVPPAMLNLGEADGEPDGRMMYRFGAADLGRGLLRDGWMHDPHGDAWADDRFCTLELPAPAREGAYLALFNLSPLFIRSFLTRQRINILLSGAVIGQYITGIETSLAIPLPSELYEPGGVLTFTLGVPDGLPMLPFHRTQTRRFLSLILASIEIVPAPPRHAALVRVRDDDVSIPTHIAVSDRFLNENVEELPGAVKTALGVEMTDILQHFESLGDNCAFGLAQRKGGCEVLGLLRFANAPLKSLMLALDDEFRAASDRAGLGLRQPDGPAGEYCLYAERYGIRWHTNVFAGDLDEDTIFAQQTMRLTYLRRKFYEALRTGRKIMTISRAEPRKHPIPLPFAGEPNLWEERSEPLRFAEVLPLFLRLNQYGPNTLLYLTRCAHGRRSGTVELVAPGVMHGYVDDFVIGPDPARKDHAAWLRVAVNAWLLDKGPNASFRSPSAA